MAKLFHIPTMERVMDAVHADLNNLPAPIEVLLFTVYYGAITSMQSADVSQKNPILLETVSTILTCIGFARHGDGKDGTLTSI